MARATQNPQNPQIPQTGDAPPLHHAGETFGSGGDWVLDRLLGRGPFTEVWLAHDRQNASAPRAVKVFTGPGAAEWLVRRQNGLRTIMRNLRGQPHVVQLLSVGVLGHARAGQASQSDQTAGRPEHGQTFVAMEYIPGGSLEDWVLEPAGRRAPLPKDQIMGGVVSALAEAHRQGIHHGALRLSRILLTRRPVVPPRDRSGTWPDKPPEVRAKIAGFGLADPGASAMEADRTYEPPEAWGAGAGWDPMGDDVFAVGVVWYQLLAEKVERPPYDFADLLADAGHDGHTIRLLSRCLARPERRFASAAELDEAFGEVGLPQWPPVPARCFDVSQIVREYLRGQGKT